MKQPPAPTLHPALEPQPDPSPLRFVANHTLQLPPRQQPSKLWELDEAHHCPIIGTCINAEELQKLARKLGFECEQKSAFAQHVKAVGYCRKRNSVAEGLQKFLDRKYADWLQHFGKIDSTDGLRQAWQQCRGNGEVAGPLWAIFTHRHCGAALRQQLYADIHMLSHQLGATQAADVRRLARLESDNIQLRRIAEQRDSRQQQQLAQLREQLAQQQARLQQNQQTQQRLARFESGQAYIDMGRQLIVQQEANQQLHAELARQQQLLRQQARWQDELRQAHAAQRQLETERNALERLLLASADTELAPECQRCPAAPRNILYVGGRTAMTAHYRELAARLGIRLIHHDGGQEEALSRLPEMIQGVDAVLCPTDCVSHSAYYHLKQQCKRVGKPCLFFKGAGVSSLAVAMERLARGEASLGAEATRPTPV